MLEELVTKHQKSFGELDREIIAYMLNNEDKLKQLSITDLADLTYTSKSTVLRLVKKLGFSGYSEFKYHLKISGVPDKDFGNDDLIALQAKDIKRTLELLEQVEWLEILETLYNAQVVYAYGTGFSQRRALDEFSKSLLQLGKKAIVIPNKTELDMTMPMITTSDVLLIASLSGETERIRENVLTLGLRKIPTLSIARSGENFLSQHSDFALHYYTSHIAIREQVVESMFPLALVMDYTHRKLIEYTLSR